MFDMMSSSKITRQHVKNLRENRKTHSLQQLKKKQSDDVKVPFIYVSLIIDINNNDSVDQLRRLIKQIHEITCDIKIFRKIVNKLIKSMNKSVQSLCRGYIIISGIFLILNEQQKQILHQVVDESKLRQWINISYHQTFNFLKETCQYNQKWKQLSSSLFLNLGYTCIKVGNSEDISNFLSFFEQIIYNQDLLHSFVLSIRDSLQDWIQKQHTNALKLIIKMIEFGFSIILTELQSLYQISIILFKKVYANNPSLIIKFFCLLKTQNFDQIDNKNFSILGLSGILNKLCFQKIISQLSIEQRINFYRFIDNFSKILNQLQYIKNEGNIIKKIKNTSIKYQQEYGNDQSRSYAEDINQLEQII